jgi:hypothetical protein
MSKILQFKITLRDSKPEIWRRFQVEDTLMFHDLHLVIQTVMGWSNSHLYQFIYEGNNYIGNPEMLEQEDIADDKDVALSAIFDKPKISMEYEYDFGDSWEHDLILEKIIESDLNRNYPNCLEGKMNCPPEDSGGIFGFYENMKIFKNKKHREHKEIKEWIGKDYNPDFFDLQTVNENLKSYKDMDLGFN